MIDVFSVSTVSVELKPVEGNPQRGIWKTCCWRMAEEVRTQHCPHSHYVTVGAMDQEGEGGLKKIFFF